ncbi:MAG: OOP family OmpA-OmpF porin [Cyclobacteriaceae bacterium]|jgi:outer membrane protein OmpA-like peptidoglycan-associated protein
MQLIKKLSRAIFTIVIASLFYSASAQYDYDDYLRRRRLGDHINTSYTETKPIISYDNKILYLTRQNHPDNVAGEEDVQDIYYSLRDNDGSKIWGTPKNVGGPLNNEHPNGISSLSIDGDTILVINEFYDYGYEKGASISVQENGEWSTPAPIEINKFKNLSNYVDYFVTADGQRLFLAIESKKTFGDQDIYISNRLDATHWSEPINLGQGVNTELAEFSPFLSPDNKTLFFSSYGHDSYGQCDVFYSKRLDDTWTNWSDAKNLGENINTEGFEAYFTIPSKGDWAYFISDVGSNADSRDIFRAIIPLELNPTPGVIVSGITFDELVMGAMTASVSIKEINGELENKIFETNNPKHEFRRSILEFPKTFQLLAETKDFMSTSQYLTIDYSDKREIKRDLYMVPIVLGNTLVSHDLSFLKDSDKFDERGQIEINRVVQYMKDYPEIKMVIDSYVASTGNASHDSTLADSRKVVVYDYFITSGITEDRLMAASHGSNVPYENTNNIQIYEGNNFDDRITFTLYADNDGDGIVNAKDNCIDEPGVPENQGCPKIIVDNDGDGVVNDIDKCIDEPGIPENQGCPAIAKEILEVFELALQGIQFETSKAIILPESFEILDNVVNIMLENPQFFLKIEGHTDSQGTDESNQTLSDARAASTLKYLTDKAVEVDRLKNYGYGESRPVADNETVEGRAKNRRVVFEIVFDKSEL